MDQLTAISKQLSSFNVVPRDDGFYVDYEGELKKLTFETDASALIFPTREGEFIDDISKISIEQEYALSYPGTASMQHMVIFFPDGGGLFIGGIPSYQFAKIRVKRIGEKRISTTYNSTEHKLYFLYFEKDWKDAADIFKKIIHLDEKNTIQREPKIFLQIGVKDSFGNCNIHHFDDLRPVIDYAHKELGNRLFVHLYGTNEAGFDRMFPDYTIDPKIGGEQALTDLVQYIKDKGILTSHHYNPRIADSEWLEKHPDYLPAVVLYKNGSAVTEPYTGKKHFVMNPNNEHWFNRCMETVDYLHNIGFDYIQLDQFAYQRSFFNHDKPLQHGYKRMMEEFDARGIKYWLEGISDIHKLYAGNFYQILTRDTHLVWDDFENRRGYPHGRSYPEFFMYFYPNAEVSYQLVTENDKLERFGEKLEIARAIHASIYDVQMKFYGKASMPLLKHLIEKIKEYEA